jgi:acyl-coenzyme A synthetase/AMP-(fatty) acid ligase
VTAQTYVAKLDDIDIPIFVAELLLLDTVQNVSLRRPAHMTQGIHTSGSTGKPKGILIREIREISAIFCVVKIVFWKLKETIGYIRAFRWPSICRLRKYG